MNNNIIINDEIVGNYYIKINDLIVKTKENVRRNINSEMVILYYEIGLIINELIEKYNLEASQNQIISSFSKKLTQEYGTGYSVPNLKKMKKFYLTYRNGSTMWNRVSWSHNRIIMNIKDEKKRNFYLEECIKSNWGVRKTNKYFLL